MSHDCWVQGKITFPKKEKKEFEEFVEYVKGYVDNGETSYPKLFKVDKKKQKIEFPNMIFTNFFCFDLKNIKGKIVWSSDDGDLEGGFIEDGKSIHVDMVDFGEDNGLYLEEFMNDPDQKDEDDVWKELNWKEAVETAFHKKYTLFKETFEKGR